MIASLDLAAAHGILTHARHTGEGTLLESEAKALLDAIGIATPRRVVLPDSSAAAHLFDPPFPGGHVVLKALAPGLLHKTEAGAVRILAARRAAVIAEMDAMARRLDGQPIAGFLLEDYIRYDASLGHEFLIGLRWTADFGPVVTVGAGGVQAEFLAATLREDESLAVFSPSLIRDAAIETSLRRVAAVRLATESQRGREPRLPLGALTDVVRRFLTLAEAVSPQLLLELEVNPLVVSEKRLIALDALATLTPPGGTHVTAAPSRPIGKIGNLLEPGSIALVGVSEKSMNPGRVILRNILRAGFSRERLVVVKPGIDALDGVRCVPSLAALPEEPAFHGRDRRADVIVLSVSATTSVELIDSIARDRHGESVIVIPGGLEERAESAALVARLREAIGRSRDTAWRGPVVNGGNCLGIRSTPGSYDTFFVPEHKLPLPACAPDPIALIAGSGAFAASKSSKLERVNPVFTITIGNQTDLTVADYLEYLKVDPRVEVFAVYLEGFRPLDGARFLTVADEIAASGRTVILYRGGRTPAGHAAASSHTAAIAGDYVVTRTLARDAGVLVADSLEEFEDLVRLFAALRGRSVEGMTLGAVSNAGYESVAIADSLGPFRLPGFTEKTAAALRGALERSGLGEIVTVRNPLDLTPILDDAGYDEVVRAVLGDPGVSVGIVGCVPMTGAIQTLPRGPDHSEDLGRSHALAPRLIRIAHECRKAWVAVVDAGSLYDPFARALEEGGVPTFRAADHAMRVFGRYCDARLRHGNRAGAPAVETEPEPGAVAVGADSLDRPHPGVPIIWS